MTTGAGVGAGAESDGGLYDAVVIGGGIAGLTAAWRLRHRRVLVLEAEDRVGGRMRSETRGDYWLNFGAHLMPAPGTLVHSLAAEMGLESAPVWGSMMGLAVGDRQLTTGPVESYPLRLPLPLGDRAAFALQGIRVRNAVRAYSRASTPRRDEAPHETRARVLAYDDDRTFGEFLGHTPASVREIFACAAHRATAELDELSAGCGIGLFALVWGGKGSLIARNLIGGTGRLPAALATRLGERVRVASPVTRLLPEGDRLSVTYEHGGRAHTVHARHVVVAAQAPFAAGLVADAAPEAAQALRAMRYGAFLNVAVATNEQRAMPWDGIYAMATPGKVFDMFTNQAHALRADGPRRPGGSLMLFAGGQGAAVLSEQSDEVIVGRFVDDLVSLFPDAAHVVEDAKVHRWPLGNVFAQPGRRHLQAPLEGALGPGHNIHLAGDYFAELGNLESAARTGADAAGRIEGLLDPATHDTHLHQGATP